MRLFRETGRLKIIWDLLICAMALATGLVLPIELLEGLAYGSHITAWWMAFSLLGLIDIGFTFNTALERHGHILRDRGSIARLYLRGMFLPDLVASLPFFMASGLGFQPGWIAGLPLLRLLRLQHITSRWEELQLLQIPVLRMIRYTIALALITNGIACLWLWVGLAETGPDGWIQRLQLSRANFPDLYLHSLYWTVTTLATVGYGDITPKTSLEIALAIAMMITGAILLAFAVGNVVSILSQLDGGRLEHRNRQSAITRYLQLNGVERDTIDRIRRFNDYQWARTRGINPRQILAELPAELRSEVTIRILHDSVIKVPLFQEASSCLKKRLLAELIPVTFPPSTVVLEDEAMGEQILFITSGNVAINTNEPLPAEVLRYGPGDYVGDLAFFLHERRSDPVISQTYVEAFLLSRQSFDALCRSEPRFKELLRKVASKQTERNQTLLIAGVIV
jgi:Ion transport protein/Cyclic nucleotide-binding domain